VGCIPFADQLVRLVAVEALVVLLRPARVLVLLGILGGLQLPSLGRLAGLDRLVLLLGVTLLGHRYNCGVNDLSAARNVALGLEIWPKRSNRLSISPACANASRNSQIVVASGTGSSRLRSRKCMNDRRSRIRYSVCSSERLWSDCSTTILNFKIAS